MEILDFSQVIDFEAMDDETFICYCKKIYKHKDFLGEVIKNNDVSLILSRLKRINDSRAFSNLDLKFLSNAINFFSIIVFYDGFDLICRNSSSFSFDARKRFFEKLPCLTKNVRSCWGLEFARFIEEWEHYTKKSFLTNEIFYGLKDFFDNIKNVYDMRENKDDLFLGLYCNDRVNCSKIEEFFSKLKELYFCSIHLNQELVASSLIGYEYIVKIGNIIDEYREFVTKISAYNIDKISSEVKDTNFEINACILDFLIDKYDIDETFYFLVSDYNLDSCDFSYDYRNKIFNGEVTCDSAQFFRKLYNRYLVIDKFNIFCDSKRFLYDVLFSNCKYRDYYIKLKYEKHFFSRNSRISPLIGTGIKRCDLSSEQISIVASFVTNYTEYYNKKKKNSSFKKSYRGESYKELAVKRDMENKRKMIESSIELVYNFICDYPSTRECFCFTHQISVNRFDIAVRLIKKNAPIVFDLYQKMCSPNRIMYYELLCNDMKNVFDDIMGCDDDCKLLNYYRCSKYPIWLMYKLLKTRVIDVEREELDDFFNRYGDDSPLDEASLTSLLNMPFSYFINDSEYFFTPDEKNEVLLKLKSEEIPITKNTVVLGLNNYAKSKEKKNDKVK